MPSNLFTRSKLRNIVRMAPPSWAGIVEKCSAFTFPVTSRKWRRRSGGRESGKDAFSQITLTDSSSTLSEGTAHDRMDSEGVLLDPEEFSAVILQADVTHLAAMSEFHHVEEDFLPVPPSTPLLQQDSDPTERHTLYAPNSGPAQPLTADPIVQGVTYDAILASSLSKALEMMMMAEMTDDMDRGRMAPSEPETETKAPPNSPMGTFKLGMDKHMRKSVLVRTTRRRERHAYRYVSLVAASMAIMENRV